MVRQGPAALCPASTIMCVITAAQPQKVSQPLAEEPVHVTVIIAYSRAIEPTARVPRMAREIHCCPDYFFFISFARPASLCCQQYVYIYCIYIYLTAYRDSK